MSTGKSIRAIIFMSLLLGLVNCGGDKSESRKAQKNLRPICGELDCLTSVNWKILLPGRSFPENSKVDINGLTVLDECLSKQKFVIDRSTEPQHLYLENYIVPKRGRLSIEITEQGPDCLSSSSFISAKNVDFDVSKSVNKTEVIINL